MLRFASRQIPVSRCSPCFPVRCVHFRANRKAHPVFPDRHPDRHHVQLNAADDNPTPHIIWTVKEMNDVKFEHRVPETFVDHAAYWTIRAIRLGFDVFSGYLFGPLTYKKFLRRCLFLETVAGVPGMVAGALRHLSSLRYMRPDNGYIHMFLEEAENERMHMLVFLNIKNPSMMFRAAVLVAQFIFWNSFFVAYLASPLFCHRVVGYLEEEAVRTYSHGLSEMCPGGKLQEFAQRAAPHNAIEYWGLPPSASMRDVVLAIRADEANHRDVNHQVATAEAGGRDVPNEHRHPAVVTKSRASKRE